jgi:hypothetical protein
VVAGWIAETQAERRLAEQRATATPAKITKTGDRLSEDEIVAIVEELGDMVTALRDAEPEHKLDVYRNLGLRLTYDPEARTVLADIDLARHRWASVRVRGSTQTNAQRPASLSTTIALPWQTRNAAQEDVTRAWRTCAHPPPVRWQRHGTPENP